MGSPACCYFTSRLFTGNSYFSLIPAAGLFPDGDATRKMTGFVRMG
jgi:hypothetical protein